MKAGIIFTFDSFDENGESQLFFDLNIKVKKNDTDVYEFLERNFFEGVQIWCSISNRSHLDLIKISTAMDWEEYEGITQVKSLYSLGHSCKWNFGKNRKDLSDWEKRLMTKYHFGEQVDMSWVGNKALAEKKMNDRIEAVEQRFRH